MVSTSYYKQIDGDYIVLLGTISGRKCGIEITEDEYNTIAAKLKTSPTVPDGYGYRLKTDLTWELYELPVTEEDITDEEALAELLEVLG